MAIKGKITENSYRQNMLDSSSSLKEFSMDRKKYYKKYMLLEKIEEKDNQAATMGRIVETLLLEPEEFDNRFYLSSSVSAPTGLMLAFVEGLYKVSKNATNEQGIVNATFQDIAQEAYEIAGYKIPLETVLNKFSGSDAQIYFNEIKTIRGRNLTVVTSNDVTFATRNVESLQTNFATKKVVNLINSIRYDVINQVQFSDYKIDDIGLKSMIDKLVIDHDEKVIKIYDLKCTWSVENFLEDYYLYRRSYIQAYLYHQVILQKTLDNTHDWFGYSVDYPYFIVCDSTNYYNPLIYSTSEEDMKRAYNGFVRRERYYPGVKEIIEDLKWAINNNMWNISKNNFETNGLVKLDK
jgi:hypothetical protein